MYNFFLLVYVCDLTFQILVVANELELSDFVLHLACSAAKNAKACLSTSVMNSNRFDFVSFPGK